MRQNETFRGYFRAAPCRRWANTRGVGAHIRRWGPIRSCFDDLFGGRHFDVVFIIIICGLADKELLAK